MKTLNLKHVLRISLKFSILFAVLNVIWILIFGNQDYVTKEILLYEGNFFELTRPWNSWINIIFNSISFFLFSLPIYLIFKFKEKLIETEEISKSACKTLLIVGLFFGLFTGGILSTSLEIPGEVPPLIFGSLIGLICGLYFGLLFKSSSGLFFVLPYGLSFGFIYGVCSGINFGIGIIFPFGFIMGVFLGVLTFFLLFLINNLILLIKIISRTNFCKNIWAWFTK